MCFRGNSHFFHSCFGLLSPSVSKDLWKRFKDGWRPAPWPSFLGMLISHASLQRTITSLLGVQLFSPYPIYHCFSSCRSARDKISGKFFLSSKMIHAFWNLVHLGLSVSLARWKVFKNWFCSLFGFFCCCYLGENGILWWFSISELVWNANWLYFIRDLHS